MNRKLVHGWGINDVDYNVYKYERVNGKSKRIWKCPYYADWANMIQGALGHLIKIPAPHIKRAQSQMNGSIYLTLLNG